MIPHKLSRSSIKFSMDELSGLKLLILILSFERHRNCFLKSCLVRSRELTY